MVVASTESGVPWAMPEMAKDSNKNLALRIADLTRITVHHPELSALGEPHAHRHCLTISAAWTVPPLSCHRPDRGSRGHGPRVRMHVARLPYVSRQGGLKHALEILAEHRWRRVPAGPR